MWTFNKVNKMWIEICEEQIDSIVVQRLTDSQKYLEDDILTLEQLISNGTKLENYQYEDLKEFKKSLKGVKRTLKYFSN